MLKHIKIYKTYKSYIKFKYLRIKDRYLIGYYGILGSKKKLNVSIENFKYYNNISYDNFYR